MTLALPRVGCSEGERIRYRKAPLEQTAIPFHAYDATGRGSLVGRLAGQARAFDAAVFRFARIITCSPPPSKIRESVTRSGKHVDSSPHFPVYQVSRTSTLVSMTSSLIPMIKPNAVASRAV